MNSKFLITSMDVDKLLTWINQGGQRTSYIRVIFFIENFIMAEIFQPSDKIKLISSPCQRQCELLPSLGVRCLSSVNFSHFNLLLWNPSDKMKWNLVGSIYGRSSLKITRIILRPLSALIFFKTIFVFLIDNCMVRLLFSLNGISK
jgi:hypothetical protein